MDNNKTSPLDSVARPLKELKGFEMIELQPNETKTVTFVINQNTIQYYTANSKWEAKVGDFKIFIGGNSATTLESNFQYTN